MNASSALPDASVHVGIVDWRPFKAVTVPAVPRYRAASPLRRTEYGASAVQVPAVRQLSRYAAPPGRVGGSRLRVCPCFGTRIRLFRVSGLGYPHQASRLAYPLVGAWLAQRAAEPEGAAYGISNLGEIPVKVPTLRCPNRLRNSLLSL